MRARKAATAAFGAALTLLTIGIAPSQAAVTPDRFPSNEAPLMLDAEATGEQALRLTPPEEVRQADIADRRLMFPGITDAEAIAYNEAYDSMLDLAYKLEDKTPELYAYYKVEDSKVFTATLFLKNAPSAVLEMALREGPPGLAVRNDARLNVLERTTVTRAANLPFANPALISTSSARYDYPTNTIRVEIVPSAHTTFEAVTSSAPSQVSLPLAAEGIGEKATIPVTYAEGLPTQFDAVMSGGTALGDRVRTQDNPRVRTLCTASFGAVDPGSGRRGIITAEHCGQSLTYEGSFSIYPKAQADRSVLADARFFSNASHSSRNVFIWAQNTGGGFEVRQATSTGNVGVGGRVCNFGINTRDKHYGVEKCTYVESLGEDWNGCNDTGCYNAGNQIRTTADITIGGDSGGPWYVNLKALGVHSNSTEDYAGASGYSQYSSILDAQRKTNAYVLTN